ncbi:Uncharacterized protein HZ326_25866 [Fusarium oxysporum f. sp. albedinis]|nr:Uncharacterized protein HZ326_25866 [Fusarium oxysporum f. sp. albedinis]
MLITSILVKYCVGTAACISLRLTINYLSGGSDNLVIYPGAQVLLMANPASVSSKLLRTMMTKILRRPCTNGRLSGFRIIPRLTNLYCALSLEAFLFLLILTYRNM